MGETEIEFDTELTESTPFKSESFLQIPEEEVVESTDKLLDSSFDTELEEPTRTDSSNFPQKSNTTEKIRKRDRKAERKSSENGMLLNTSLDRNTCSL